MTITNILLILVVLVVACASLYYFLKKKREAPTEKTINIYDKERMLIELARGKNQMWYDMYKEIIANYRKIADNLDMEKIERYLSYFPYEDKLFEIIQDEVF